MIKTTTLERNMVSERVNRNQLELDAFAMLLKGKNDLLEMFKNILERIQVRDNQEDRIEILKRLTQSNILTEDDWKKFKGLFNKVYPGFFIRLKESTPELSAADIRMAALIKLNISQKEMAEMLGIGYDAVRKAKQRLRAKLNLNKEETVEEFVKAVK